MAATSNSAAPAWQQLLFFVFGPPIAALVFRTLSRRWAHTVQGEKISLKTEKRQKVEFWAMLIFMYLMLACIFTYGCLKARVLTD